MGAIFKIVANKTGETGEGELKRTELSINNTQEGKEKKKKTVGNQVKSHQISRAIHKKKKTLYNKVLKNSLSTSHFYIFCQFLLKNI